MEPPLRASGGARVELKLMWREAGPPNHLNDKVDSDQQLVDQELSLSGAACEPAGCGDGWGLGLRVRLSISGFRLRF